MDADIDILIENTVFCIVLGTIKKEVDLVNAVLYVVAILVFHHYCLGIKPPKVLLGTVTKILQLCR
jgi:hypothetical protein